MFSFLGTGLGKTSHYDLPYGGVHVWLNALLKRLTGPFDWLVFQNVERPSLGKNVLRAFYPMKNTWKKISSRSHSIG